MEFIIGLVKILIGSFILFTLARVTYDSIGKKSKWGWVVFVGGLALINMLIYRIFGSSINPPFFTSVWFAITLLGLTPKESPIVSLWYKRGVYAIVLGTIIGWASYAEVVTLP